MVSVGAEARAARLPGTPRTQVPQRAGGPSCCNGPAALPTGPDADAGGRAGESLEKLFDGDGTGAGLPARQVPESADELAARPSTPCPRDQPGPPGPEPSSGGYAPAAGPTGDDFLWPGTLPLEALDHRKFHQSQRVTKVQRKIIVHGLVAVRCAHGSPLGQQAMAPPERSIPGDARGLRRSPDAGLSRHAIQHRRTHLDPLQVTEHRVREIAERPSAPGAAIALAAREHSPSMSRRTTVDASGAPTSKAKLPNKFQNRVPQDGIAGP